MQSLSSLLKRFQDLTLELAGVQQQILTVGSAPPPPPRRGRPKGSATVGVPEGVKAVVALLRGAEGPLPRREIASRLNLAGSAAGFQLARAVKMGLAVKVNHGRYTHAPEVPEGL